MSVHFDDIETRRPAEREAALFKALPDFLRKASAAAPGLARWLSRVNPEAVTDRSALARLPVLRKSELMEFQQADPPFGGFAVPAALAGNRVFLSPGPL